MSASDDDDENIISDKRHGFKKGHSCETQLITTVYNLLASADVGNRVYIAILDFSKAFDMVSHRRLMSKLDHYGIKGNIYKWISSFLNNGNQKVVIDGYFSDTIYVDWGMKFNAKKCYLISNEKAARFVTNNYKRECGLPSNQLIDSLGWTSWQEPRKTARLRMLYKAINREVALSIDMLCRPDSRTRGITQNFRAIKTRKRSHSF